MASARTQIGGPGHTGPKVFSSTLNPAVDNDQANGCERGDIWINTVAGVPLICSDNTLGAAVWGASAASKTAFASLGAVLAATTTGKATQKDLSGAGTGAMAALVQPDVPRNIKLTITDGNASISAYSIAIVGTAADGSAVTETLTFANGLTPAGSKIFATVTSVTVSSIVGNGAGDTLDLGYGSKLGVPVPATATALSIKKISVNKLDDAVAATDTANNSFTTTTAPDGTKVVAVWFTYTG
jgi:hypothetical protein